MGSNDSSGIESAGTGFEPIAAAIRGALLADARSPRYEVLTAELERLIRDRLIEPGAALPTEPELAAKIGMSRTTIRRALDELARRGLVTRRRGIGTFATTPAVEQPLGQLASFLQTLAAQRESTDAHLLGVRLTIDDVASTFFFDNAEQVVFEISRLLSVNDEPFALERIYLPRAIGERLPLSRLGSAVIDELLQEYAEITVDHGDETIELAKLERESATLLQARRSEPAFLLQRMVYAGEQPVQVRRTLIRGDRVRFRLRLQGPKLAPAGTPGILTTRE